MSNRARLLSCLAIGLLVPALVYAQPVVMQAKSALSWVFGPQILIVTVAEVGDTDEASQVTIEIRDAANVVKASMPPRSLTAGTPVTSALKFPPPPSSSSGPSSPLPFRPHPTSISRPSAWRYSNPASLTIRTLPPCAVPIDQMPSSGGGAEGNCGGGWHVTSRTSVVN